MIPGQNYFIPGESLSSNSGNVTLISSTAIVVCIVASFTF
jgi:hypothetical protein